MFVWLHATAKVDATPEAIQAMRRAWITQGKDRQLGGRCGSAWRYVVQGQTPSQVFWLLETENQDAPKILTDHFGDLWDIKVHEVVPEALG